MPKKKREMPMTISQRVKQLMFGGLTKDQAIERLAKEQGLALVLAIQAEAHAKAQSKTNP